MLASESPYTRPQDSLDFCVGVAPGASRYVSSAPASALDVGVEPPIAFWHRQSDRLLSFNGAFAALVEYSPEELLGDFHCAQLDRYGCLNGVSRMQPSTIRWVFETGRRRPKRVVLTIIPLNTEILWLPRELEQERPSSPITEPPPIANVQLAAQSPAPSFTVQRELVLVKVRSNNKRPWAKAIVKFDLKVPKEKELLTLSTQ